MKETRKLLNVRRYRAGYEVRTEEVNYSGLKKPLVMRSAFTPNGDYIGDPARARALVVKLGIRPQKISPTSNVCSIGFCEKDKKWYGWSHRAIFGFGVGSKVKNGDSFDGKLPVGFTAKTLADAKKMAVAFARSVS